MSKPGSGGVLSASRSNVDRRDRVSQLTSEVIDLSKDPYFMKNHLGTYECKLCLTLHNNEGNYLAHTQGKKHKTNIARRMAKEARDRGEPEPHLLATTSKPKVEVRKTPKIGLPGYKVAKQKDPETGQYSLLIEIHYPKIEPGLQPRHRLMSCYEQKKEAPDPNFRYLLFAAEPYETVAFKIPSWDIERDAQKQNLLYTNWDRNTLTFTMQITFKSQNSSMEDDNS